MTFQPKEIFVRTKKPKVDEEEVFDAALVIVPPRTLTIEEAGDELVYSWTDQPNRTRGALFVCGILTALVWASEIARNDKIGYSIFLFVLVVAAYFQSRPAVKLRMAKHHLFSGRGMLLLSDVKELELFGPRLFAVKQDDKRELIVDGRDEEIAAYLRNTIAKRIDVRIPDKKN